MLRPTTFIFIMCCWPRLRLSWEDREALALYLACPAAREMILPRLVTFKRLVYDLFVFAFVLLISVASLRYEFLIIFLHSLNY